jgi:hypothetical protein
MTEEERRRYALEQQRAAEAPQTDEASQELEFDEPRHDPGHTKANLEDKDGTGALVDEEEHARRVRQQGKGRNRERRDRP